MMEEVLELLAQEPDRALEEAMSHMAQPCLDSDACDDFEHCGPKNTEDEPSIIAAPMMATKGKDTVEADGSQRQEGSACPSAPPPVQGFPLLAAVTEGLRTFRQQFAPTPPEDVHAHGFPYVMCRPCCCQRVVRLKTWRWIDCDAELDTRATRNFLQVLFRPVCP